MASGRGRQTLTNYQEVCIRALHRMLDKYLHGAPIEP